MSDSKNSPHNPSEFLQGFLQGVRETPRGYFAPAMILWRPLRNGLQWWFMETKAISEEQRRR
jgi:hypothetical protein